MQSVFLFSDTTYFLNNTHVSAAITGKSPFTSSTYTHNDIFKNYNIYNGIDVSKYNGDINWDKVKRTVSILSLSVSVTEDTENPVLLCTDPNYKANIEGALAAGIKVGVYYFTEALTTDEAREEAEFCISKIKDYNITLPVAIDYEYPTDGKILSEECIMRN